jgi:hypothetical protein
MELRNEVTSLLDILKLVQEQGEQAPEVGLSGLDQNILENLRTLLLEEECGRDKKWPFRQNENEKFIKKVVRLKTFDAPN